MEKLQDVREYSRGGDFCSSAGSLHDERRARITVSGECKDVIASPSKSKRMISWNFDEASVAPAVCKLRDTQQDAPTRMCLVIFLLKSLVCEREPPEELFCTQASQIWRHKVLSTNIVEIHLPSNLAGEDKQLARNVFSPQIIPGIGVGESQLVRLTDELAERSQPIIRIKQITQRARQYPLDLLDCIS